MEKAVETVKIWYKNEPGRKKNPAKATKDKEEVAEEKAT